MKSPDVQFPAVGDFHVKQVATEVNEMRPRHLRVVLRDRGDFAPGHHSTLAGGDVLCDEGERGHVGALLGRYEVDHRSSHRHQQGAQRGQVTTPHLAHRAWNSNVSCRQERQGTARSRG